MSLYLQKNNIVIHCNAGVGRTGIMAACLVKYINECSGEDAISYIKKYMMTDLTDEQQRFIVNWAEKYKF